MFEAIEEEDRSIESEDGGPSALLGSCNDRAKQLHASASGSFVVQIFYLIISSVIRYEIVIFLKKLCF